MRKQQSSDIRRSGSWIGISAYLVAVILVVPMAFLPGAADPVQPVRMAILPIFTLIPLILIATGRGGMKSLMDLAGSRLSIAFAAYILLVALSMFFAVNAREGVFDLFRTVLSYLTLLLFAWSLTRNEQGLELAIKLVLIASLVFAATGLVQYLLHATGRGGEGLYSGLYLVKGFSGHKVSYSIMLFLSIPFLSYGLYVFGRVWKVVSGLGLFLALLLIILTQTRAVWIGISVALLVTFSYYAYYRLRARIGIFPGNFRIVFYPVMLILLFGVSYFAVSPAFRKVVSYQVSGMTDADMASNQPRLSIQDATLAMILDQPLTGVGAGNWKICIPPYQHDYVYYMTDIYRPEVRFQNWMRPHNDLAWVLSEKGPLGLLAYLAVFIVLFLTANRAIHDVAGTKPAFLLILLQGTVAGYLVLSAFSFPLERIDNQVYLMILMATVLAMSDGAGMKRSANGQRGSRVFSIAAIILTAAALAYGILLLKTEHDLSRLVNAGENTGQLKDIENAVLKDAALVPLDPFANPLKYYVGVGRLRANDPVSAMGLFKEAIKDHPNNLNLLHSLSTTSLKMRDPEASIRYSKALLDIFPWHPEGLMNLSVAYYMQGKYDRSLQALLTIKGHDPAVDRAIRMTVSALDRQHID